MLGLKDNNFIKADTNEIILVITAIFTSALVNPFLATKIIYNKIWGMSYPAIFVNDLKMELFIVFPLKFRGITFFQTGIVATLYGVTTSRIFPRASNSNKEIASKNSFKL